MKMEGEFVRLSPFTVEEDQCGRRLIKVRIPGGQIPPPSLPFPLLATSKRGIIRGGGGIPSQVVYFLSFAGICMQGVSLERGTFLTYFHGMCRVIIPLARNGEGKKKYPPSSLIQVPFLPGQDENASCCYFHFPSSRVANAREIYFFEWPFL